MSSHACSLCGLRYPAQSLLDLHIREDHARRDDKPEAAAAAATAAPAAPAAAAPAAPAASADTSAPPPASAPGAGRLSWAETAWRALHRMMGKEPADPPHRAA